jgi:hypothetical protein
MVNSEIYDTEEIEQNEVFWLIFLFLSRGLNPIFNRI